MIHRRNEKMFVMREKGSTFDEISKKFKLSSERVRQIITHEPNFCVRHCKYFMTTCPYCEIEKTHQSKYESMSLDELVREASVLRNLGKTRLDVLKKRIYVRLLKDMYSYSFSAIGKLLHKDHTTIMNLYSNN